MSEQQLYSRKQRRDTTNKPRRRKVGWMWHLPLMLILLGAALTIVYFWHTKDQEKVAVFDHAQQRLIHQQQPAHFQCTKDHQNKLEIITYQPKNEKFTKEAPLIHQQFLAMKEAFLKKHSLQAGTTWIQKIEKQELNPKMNKIILSSQFFTWNKSKAHFNQHPLQQSVLLLSSETGQEPTAKQIIGSEENLLTIKPIVQQKILEQVKAPDQAINAVLNLPNLSFEQKITIADKQLIITLPQKIAELNQVSIPLNSVLPYIDQNYVMNQPIE